MTKEFNQKIICPFCRNEITVESDHDRWMRKHELLDSVKEGIVLTNCDHIILRYKRPWSDRDVQTKMIVEIKTHGRELDQPQAEIFSFLNQSIRWTAGLYPYSKIAGKRVHLLNFGAHLLQYEKTYALNSKWIKWDGRVIDTNIESTLVTILRMDVVPDDIDMAMDPYLRHLWPQAS